MRLHSIPNTVVLLTIILLLFISCCASTYFGLNHALFELTENQIMYLYSTSAQVLAAVYGLTLTGYIFLRGDLNREARSDETRAKSIEKLEGRYFWQLAVITALVMFTILLTNLVIAQENSKNTEPLTYLMNFSQSFFAISFVAIAFFVVDIVGPGNIQAASQALQDKIDPEHNVKTMQGDLSEFLKSYNNIESILNTKTNIPVLTTDFSNKKYNKHTSNTRLAEILLRREKINNELFSRLKNLITLRNAIIHGADPSVSQHMVDESKSILEELNKSLDNVDQMHSETDNSVVAP
ncbi:hypothetical protein [Pseudomonas atagonensis]|uniref:hypothetical protein n=1 Tax=Pseudomonas atagonensis TaxID=2609964 RepID=UPI00140B8326|nr:hypothetical protein [Pseudomonas atagonensis]